MAENLTSKILNDVAYNRLPDLAVRGLNLNAECGVIVELANLGPADLPPETWEGAASFLRISREGEPVDSVAIGSLDPERLLRAAGGRATYLLPTPVSADTVSFEAMVDPHGVVTERREGNNERSVELSCAAPPSANFFEELKAKVGN